MGKVMTSGLFSGAMRSTFSSFSVSSPSLFSCIAHLSVVVVLSLHYRDLFIGSERSNFVPGEVRALSETFTFEFVIIHSFNLL